MSDPYRETLNMLASILRKYQGIIDAETNKEIDIGGEVMTLRNHMDAMRAEITRLRSLLERARPMVAAEAALSRHYGSADETDTAVALLADIEENT